MILPPETLHNELFFSPGTCALNLLKKAFQLTALLQYDFVMKNPKISSTSLIVHIYS